MSMIMIRRHAHVLLTSQYWLLRVSIHSKSLESLDCGRLDYKALCNLSLEIQRPFMGEGGTSILRHGRKVPQ